jgi:hypothetical protein
MLKIILATLVGFSAAAFAAEGDAATTPTPDAQTAPKTTDAKPGMDKAKGKHHEHGKHMEKADKTKKTGE